MDSKQIDQFIESLRNALGSENYVVTQFCSKVDGLCRHPVLGKVIADNPPFYLKRMEDVVTPYRRLVGDWSNVAYLCIRKLILFGLLEGGPYYPFIQEMKQRRLRPGLVLSLLELLVFDREVHVLDKSALSVIGIIVDKHRDLDPEPLSWVVVGALSIRQIESC